MDSAQVNSIALTSSYHADLTFNRSDKSICEECQNHGNGISNDRHFHYCSHFGFARNAHFVGCQNENESANRLSPAARNL